jgi:hypothetical protein
MNDINIPTNLVALYDMSEIALKLFNFVDNSYVFSLAVGSVGSQPMGVGIASIRRRPGR